MRGIIAGICVFGRGLSMSLPRYRSVTSVILAVLLGTLPTISGVGSAHAANPPGAVDLLAGRNGLRASGLPGRPHVALALSGGGARGLAQIGVLRAFEESGIVIDLICGVSMGAIVGGLYAGGITSDSLKSLVRSVDWTGLLQNTPSRTGLLLSQKDRGAEWFLSLPMHGLRPRWPTGATSGQRLYNFLSDLTRDATYRSGADFDKLPIRFRAVSTDLVTGQRNVLSGGELAFAMRASMAFPLAITPLRDGDRLLADGGLVDPLPVELASSLSAAPVVAVNTATGLAELGRLTDPYAMANQATSVMTAPRLAQSLSAADYVCQPVSPEITNVDFNHLDTLITLGYLAGRTLAAQVLSDAGQGASWSEADPQERLSAPGSNDQPSGSSASPTDSSLPPLSAMHIRGNTVYAESTLIAAVRLPVGGRYGFAEYTAGLQRLRRFYADRHYALADVAAAALDSGGMLTITLDEAPLAGIDLQGNTSVKRWVVLRSFPMKRGHPYNARTVARGLADLHATGLFDQITTGVVRTPEGPRLQLTVSEKTADALRFGLHHNLEYQTEGFVQWAKINLFGLGNELTAHAQYSPRREQYFLRAKSDRVFRTYLAAAARLYHQRHERHLYGNHEQTGEFATTREGFEASLAQNISRIAQMALVVNSENINLDVSLERDTLHTRYRHSRVALLARLDDLDDANFPTRGRRLSAQLSWGDRFLRGASVYRAFEMSAEWVLSPNKSLTLSAGARVATADRPLPLAERFALGGRRSFMGLADDELLGDHLVAGTMNARYRVFPLSYIFARLDVGSAWPHGAGPGWHRQVRLGAGAGLMFDTPLGPLQIIQGLADSGDRTFYFNWGYDF